MRLGVALVRLGEPGWIWDQLVALDSTDTLKNPPPGQVESVREFGMLTTESDSAAERAFIVQIDERLARSKNQELVFYVHGYRVFFDEVTVMMGSWSHYLGHGAMATFQWPRSEGNRAVVVSTTA